MIRVVVDTNVVVSANLNDHGFPAAVMDLAANKIILMFVSPSILAEYKEVLSRPRLKLTPVAVEASLAVIRKTSELVKPIVSVDEAADEPDNRFLECADAAQADFLITGNTRHFPKSYKSTRIVTPREFIELLGATLLQPRS